MNELIGIAIKCVGLISIAYVTYVVVPAIKQWRSTKLTDSQQDQLTFWVETGTLWAKQWLQSKSGEEKKAAVMQFVMDKVNELNLPYSENDVDKTVEAIYATVKDIADAATGNTSSNDEVSADAG